MAKRVIERFFSFARWIFFEEFSPKFNAVPFKNFVDFAYVIFEKIAYRFDIISSNYLKMYEEIVEKEIKMANISSEDSILVIGCGSLPVTSTLIAMKTKARIVSIDTDHKAILNATKFIKHNNLENIIKLEHVDGLNYPVEKFDVIYISYGVKQQKEIMIYLANKMKKGARIIFRTVIDAQDETLRSPIDLSKWFLVKNSLKSETIIPAGSYLLLKKSLQ